MLNFIFYLLFFIGCNPVVLKSNDNDTSTVVTSTAVENCKNVAGYKICNELFKDENGDYQDLYQSKGMPVVIDFSVMWCAPCILAAKHAQEVHDDNKDINLVYITILLENFIRGAPSTSDIKKWKSDHGVITPPVYSGDRSMINSIPEDGYPITSWPTFYFLDKDMKILYINKGYSKESLDYYIKDLYR